MYNQGNMCLHVDLFNKYVSNNAYSDNNHGQPQSISNIFLTFFSSLYFMTTFVAYFRSDIDIIVVFLPRREPKGGRSGRWETHKKYGHPNQ